MLELKISWKVLKIFTQECSNDGLGLTLIFLFKIKFSFWAFIWEELMDFSSPVRKYRELLVTSPWGWAPHFKVLPQSFLTFVSQQPLASGILPYLEHKHIIA